VIGQPLDRPEGALKVSGQATYAAEWRIDGCVEGVLVLAEIAQGQVTAIDRDAALARDGVLAVIADPAMTRRSAQSMAARRRSRMPPRWNTLANPSRLSSPRPLNRHAMLL
jgi:xanthine dehydrogenase YagR molybdenum-binding subunit